MFCKKRFLTGSLIMIVVLCVYIVACAAGSGNCGDNLTWNLDDDGLLTISGTGTMKDFGWYDQAPWEKGGVKAVVIGNGATNIGGSAFRDCINLKSISIPYSVTSISERAFQSCENLTSIMFPDNIESIGYAAFENCPAVKYASIGSEAAKAISGARSYFRVPGTKYDLKYEFEDNVATKLIIYNVDSDVTDITIPTEVTEIYNRSWSKESAFASCENLKSLTMNKTIGEIDFSSLFQNCLKLEEINYPSDHEIYSSKAGFVFNKDGTELLYCPKGKTGDCIIPDTTKTISSDAFNSCKLIATIHIPISVTSIMNSAFKDCTALMYAKVEARSDKIDFSSIFSGCTNLKNISIPGDHHTYCSVDGVVYSKDKKTLIYCPTGRTGSYSIPEGVETIGMSAFEGCIKLNDVLFPETIGSIDWFAFRGCTNLKELDLPDSLRFISWGAFENCSSLTDLIIPVKVWSIGIEAFKGCTSMKSTTIYEGVSSIGSDAFEKTVLIKTPKDSYAAKWAYEHYYEIQYIKSVRTVTISNDGNGTATASSYSGTEGTTITLKAMPNKGYQFKDWVVIAGGITVTNNKFSIGDSNVEIRATFEIPSTVSSGGLVFDLNFEKKTAIVKCPEKKSIKSAKIPTAVKDLGGKSYKVTAIAENAFKGCNKLTTLSIGKNVTIIGMYAFNGCKKLSDITIDAKKLNTVGSNAFKNINKKAVFKCPSKKLVKTYQKLFQNAGAPKTATFK